MKITIEHVSLPDRPLSNVQLLSAVKKLNIPNFKGIYMRNEISSLKPDKNESGILNLDDNHNLNDVYGSTTGEGTHWIAWWKQGKKVNYFDSFGLAAPLEFESYVRTKKFTFNKNQIQPEGTVVCGHLCLYFLVEMAKGKTMSEIVNAFNF